MTGEMLDAGSEGLMNLTQHCRGDTAILTVTGRIDAHIAYQLLDATHAMMVDTPAPTRLVLDVAGAGWGDFAVVGLMRRLCEQADAAQARFELRGASPELAATMAASGLDADIHLD